MQTPSVQTADLFMKTLSKVDSHCSVDRDMRNDDANRTISGYIGIVVSALYFHSVAKCYFLQSLCYIPTK